jgi:hypothetical protein
MAAKEVPNRNQRLERNKRLEKETRVPEHGSAHVDKYNAIGESIQKAQALRRETLAKRPIENASANPLPTQNR